MSTNISAPLGLGWEREEPARAAQLKRASSPIRNLCQGTLLCARKLYDYDSTSYLHTHISPAGLPNSSI